MNLMRIYFITITALISLLFSCATGDIPSCLEIAPPEIHLTGEKTVIERQIVGDYRELEKDAWILSSVKTNIQRRKGTAAVISGDRILFRALKIREFHIDKIRDYKNSGAIGEGNTGYTVYMRTMRYEKDRDLKGILLRVIEEENRARRTIFKRALVKSGIKKPVEKEILAFGRIFAKEQRALAKTNDWIQQIDLKWVKKK